MKILILFLSVCASAQANPKYLAITTDPRGAVTSIRHTDGGKPGDVLIPWVRPGSIEPTPLTTHLAASVPRFILVGRALVRRSPADIHADIERQERRRATRMLPPVKGRLREVEEEIQSGGTTPELTELRDQLAEDVKRLRRESLVTRP